MRRGANGANAGPEGTDGVLEAREGAQDEPEGTGGTQDRLGMG